MEIVQACEPGPCNWWLSPGKLNACSDRNLGSISLVAWNYHPTSKHLAAEDVEGADTVGGR